ncbi:MAG TPA: DUF2272 domain-containing protein [Alphaproteobacteria bacterium]|nr:DUF2272 domain-containing protein [Alphaproteobacteria bacterium]
MYVDVEALNLRSTAQVAPGNRIAILHLCQEVETLSDADQNGWVKVRVDVEGTAHEGFVSGRFLREPVAEAREALVAQAIREWLRFEKGLGREAVDPFFKYVGEMWQAIGLRLDGKHTDIPWSAAAISFMVRNAGEKFTKYKNFRFSGQHSMYIFDSIGRQINEDNSAPFWGFQLFEAQPQLGDIVCKWRITPQTFETAAVSDDYKSHCDVIVRIGPDDLQAIGGNIGDSVGLTTYKKTPSGFVERADHAFALLVNKVPENRVA